jgi:hypothetical protein
MLHAGLDLSRRKLDVCLLREDGEHLDQLAVPPDSDWLRTFARRINEVHGGLRLRLRRFRSYRVLLCHYLPGGWLFWRRQAVLDKLAEALPHDRDVAAEPLALLHSDVQAVDRGAEARPRGVEILSGSGVVFVARGLIGSPFAGGPTATSPTPRGEHGGRCCGRGRAWWRAARRPGCGAGWLALSSPARPPLRPRSGTRRGGRLWSMRS